MLQINKCTNNNTTYQNQQYKKHKLISYKYGTQLDKNHSVPSPDHTTEVPLVPC